MEETFENFDVQRPPNQHRHRATIMFVAFSAEEIQRFAREAGFQVPGKRFEREVFQEAGGGRRVLPAGRDL